MPTNSIKTYSDGKIVSLWDTIHNERVKEEYKEWIQASEGSKDQPHVLYATQINIEQL